jgi:hypothetical protein
MIGTLVSKEPKLTKKEDKYYNVKTDIVVEGEEYKVSFNAFNSEYNKFADIVQGLDEGSRIEIEAEKDGKFWNLKSIKLAGVQKVEKEASKTTQTASEPASTSTFNDREAAKQISINTLSLVKVFEGSGVPIDELDSIVAKCFQIAKKIYHGAYDDNTIPF